MSALEVNGKAPELNGKTLQKLIIQEFWYDGVREEDANVVYIRVDNLWYRLFFDYSIIFWRQDVNDFENEHLVQFDETVYRFRDLGQEFGLENTKIISCDMTAFFKDASVTFHFDNRSQIVFTSVDDSTTWQIQKT